jgi:hypothetical protein
MSVTGQDQTQRRKYSEETNSISFFEISQEQSKLATYYLSVNVQSALGMW